jgi:hypothetical protein
MTTTFKELQDKLRAATFEKLVLEHLVEYIDDELRPGPSGEPRKVLMTDDNIPVPQEAYASVIESVLLSRISDLGKYIEDILSTAIGAAPVEASAGPAPVPTVPKKPKKPKQDPIPIPIPVPISAPPQVGEPQGEDK